MASAVTLNDGGDDDNDNNNNDNNNNNNNNNNVATIVSEIYKTIQNKSFFFLPQPKAPWTTGIYIYIHHHYGALNYCHKLKRLNGCPCSKNEQ